MRLPLMPGRASPNSGDSAQLLFTILAVSTSFTTASLLDPGSILGPVLSPEPPAPADHTFSLRHIFHHGTYQHPDLHRRQDIRQPAAEVWLAEEDGFGAERILPLKAKSRSNKIERLMDRRPAVVDPLVAAARQGALFASSPSAWTVDDVPSPDITNKDTVLTMALVASDAYVADPGDPSWDEVGKPYNRSVDFGWEKDGLRGHIWGDEDNSTIIIGLKGTSPAVFDGEGTTTNDKVNDNLFFSCCCAQQGQWSWHQVCDCATGTYQCNNTCVRQALFEENRYYQAARELYSNVTEIYPDSNIWISGHSLGGAVSSLLGLTYGLPVVTFEAVPEALAAGRIGLPIPPSADSRFPQTRQYTGAYHFGHTADPIYVGTCNGATSTCSFAGYAMESACHTGHECTYDTVADKGWRVGIGTHKIRSVINDVILKYDDVPECKFTPECRDCASWKMYESNSTDGTTTSSSSSTSVSRTRTVTCETPGWWGCLDESTTTGTTTTTTTTSTSTSSTSTCETPGWFGCNDPTTTTITSPSTTITSTCETPGWWGCKDATSTTMTTTTTSSETAATDPPTHIITPAPALPTPTGGSSQEKPKPSRKCISRHWYGTCKEYSLASKPDEL